MKSNKLNILSVMFCFFCMGFVDLVGIASNYVKEDLQLTDSVANIFPSLVFFWFLIFSVPTGVMMNRIGRKNTVLISLLVTVASLLLPVFGESFGVMVCAFSLLGIGNALMQTSLNPLVMCVISSKEGSLASVLTFGQFIKAIASFIAPYLAMWGATCAMPTLGLSWRVLFAVFFIVGAIATAVLASIQIDEPCPGPSPSPTPSLLPRLSGESNLSVRGVVRNSEGIGAQFANAFRLLVPMPPSFPPRGDGVGSTVVLLSFVGIMCHVGIDVGTNTTAPKILIERLGMSLNDAAFATSLYFIGRTIGCFTGSFFLRILKMRTFFFISCVLMAVSMLCMFFGTEAMVLYTGIFLVGYGNSNVFSMCFANALQAVPDRQNEVSGLMIMGLFGGTLFPLAMGVASDAMGQAGAVLCMSAGVLYLFCYVMNFGRENLPTPKPHPNPPLKGGSNHHHLTPTT